MPSEQVDPTSAPPLLGGRYEPIAQIGRGGAAEVYLVRDRVDGRRLAVKVLQERHVGHAEMRARFLREARTMSAIRHPHVVRVHEVVDGDPPFLVMDYLSGGCVLDWMRAHGPLPPRLAATLAADLCRALAAIHDAGVVHRDVKPHNLLIDADGRGQLTDFGIAKVAAGSDPDDGHRTAVGAVLGTDAFMAPEQRDDASAVDARADIYAAGATLFTLCTRRAAVELYLLDPDHEKLDEVHPALRAVVLAACRRSPDDRPSATALAAMLEAALPELPDVPPGTPSLVSSEVSDRRASSVHDDDDTTLRRDRSDGASEDGPAMSTTTESKDRPIETIGVGEPAAEAPESKLPAIPAWAAATVGVVVLVAVLTIGVLLALQSGNSGVRSAQAGAESARKVLVDTANQERMVIETLVGYGADRAVLEAAFFTLSDAEPAQRAQAASAFVDALVVQAAAVDHDGARHAIAPILERRDQWSAAVERWEDAASSPLGAAAVAVGMAPAPPR